MAHTPSGKLDDWMRQGLSLHQSGRIAEAEAFYQRVLARLPSHPAANHLLGLIRLQQGQPESAVTLISRAVHVRAGDPQYHCNLGVALNASGQPGRAVASFDRAIELQPDYPDAYSNRGMALKTLGRLAEAVESYSYAIRLKPTEAGFHLNAANALSDLGDLHEAEAAYRRALTLRPGYPAALSGLCKTLSALGRGDEAIAAGEGAIASRPGEAEYRRALGQAYWAAGKPMDALAAFREALALEPDDTEVYRLMSLLQRRVSDDDIGVMEELLADQSLADEQRLHLHFALGKAFDDIGAAERSFAHYLDGNTLQRRRAPFSLEAAGADAESLIRQFGAVPERFRMAGVSDAAPVFIVGLPRSGKSTLEGMLGRHPQLRKAGELLVMGNLVAEMKRSQGPGNTPESLDGLSGAAIAHLAAGYLGHARKLAPAGAMTIDTMPLNFWHVGFIRLALPNARIIHCVREPLEHCVAIFQKYFSRPGYGFSNDLADLAGYYGLYRQLMQHWDRQFPGSVLDVDMADLRREPESQMRRILELCGLRWYPACAIPFEPEPQIGDEPALSATERQLGLAPYQQALRPVTAWAAAAGTVPARSFQPSLSDR